MTDVVVEYHHEPEGWWAETAALPQFSAAGNSFAEVRGQVLGALPELLGISAAEIFERIVSAPSSDTVQLDTMAVGAVFIHAVTSDTTPRLPATSVQRYVHPRARSTVRTFAAAKGVLT